MSWPEASSAEELEVQSSSIKQGWTAGFVCHSRKEIQIICKTGTFLQGLVSIILFR